MNHISNEWNEGYYKSDRQVMEIWHPPPPQPKSTVGLKVNSDQIEDGDSKYAKN